MSSTNRGGARSSADYYPTPAWTVRRLLEKLELPGGTWLEPAAGDGAIIRAVARPDVKWTAWELRRSEQPALSQVVARSRVHAGDFLADEAAGALGRKRYRVAITNPPFRLAQEFVEACLRRADVVVMLLRLNFLASMERHSFMQENTPAVFVLPNRPSFTGGKTDSIEYAWLVWGLRDSRRRRVTILDLTPRSERSRGSTQRPPPLLGRQRRTSTPPKNRRPPLRPGRL